MGYPLDSIIEGPPSSCSVNPSNRKMTLGKTTGDIVGGLALH